MIISFVVALFTAPVNLVVDFLFVDILSAPTIDSLKKESSSRLSSSGLGNMFRRASTAVRKMSVVSKNAFSRLRGDSEILMTTTRVIPPRTKEAHDEAMECANDVIELARSRQDHRMKSINIRHSEFQAKKSERYRKGAISKTLKNTTPHPEADNSENVHEKVESLFSQLSNDITQQRKMLKRSQQEMFDNLWG